MENAFLSLMEKKGNVFYCFFYIFLLFFHPFQGKFYFNIHYSCFCSACFWEWVWGVLGHYGCFVRIFSVKLDDHSEEINTEF
jgi:hypothetical protein